MSQPELWNRRCANLWEIRLTSIYSRDSKVAVALAMGKTAYEMKCGREYFRMNSQFQSVDLCSTWPFNSSCFLFSLWFPSLSAPAPYFLDLSESCFLSSEPINSTIIAVLGKAMTGVVCFPSWLLPFALVHTASPVQISAVPDSLSLQDLSLLSTERVLPSHRRWGKTHLPSPHL